MRLGGPVTVGIRGLALLAAALVSCTTTLPPPSAAPASATPEASIAVSPTPKAIVPIKVRTVTTVGPNVVAAGDFAGTKRTEVAVISDPKSDLSVQINVLGKAPDAPGDLWFQTGPGVLSLARAKFAVMDVDTDGKDDLVALYDGGSNTSKIFVFKSTGSGFTFGNVWWTAEEYNWARARNVMSGRFGQDKDTLLITYQDDGARMRIHALESDGAKLTLAGTVYDSGPGKIDLAKARFTVGHFTRSGGPDQIAAFYQTDARAKVMLFEPGPSGFTLTDAYSTDADYALTRASLAAADTNEDGRDDLVSLYTDADGSAKVHVFDPAKSFAPVNGWNGEASLPAGALCPRSGALVLGDWNADGRADALALAPTPTAVRAQILTGAAGTFSVTAGTGDLRCAVWPLNGLPTNGADTTTRPLFVKVDNNPTARPHYGIAKADQVYEFLVEGLTTRLAAVFHSQQPDVIGSVRSARMTDRPILASLGAAFVYSGGGPEELMAIHYDDAVAHRYVDIAPSYGWGYRVPFRPAPYNYFTTYAAVKGAIAAAPDGTQPAIVAPWRFLPTATGDAQAGGFAGSVPATRISIPYRGGFEVSYSYDAATRTYGRVQAGAREVDGATGEVIAARDIVVIQTEVHFTTEFGLDPAGNPKLDMVQTGTGSGSVFRDGLRQDVTWTRADIVDAFTLRSASGEVVQLSPGQVWIHIVPKDWTIPSS
jgi:hypothetical protein